MSCFIVSEWNCQSHDDSAYNTVGSFHSLEEAHAFIKTQPRVREMSHEYYSLADRMNAKKSAYSRFCVDEFEGAKELRSWRATKDGQSLKL